MRAVSYIPLLLMAIFLVCPPLAQSYAQPCDTCSNTQDENEDTREVDRDEFEESAEWTDEEFHDWEMFLGHWLMPRFPPIWSAMTEQMSLTAMHQMFIIGTFFDAKHQLEVQRVFQRKTAEAHRDYHPSVDICKFGSVTRSLAASERSGVRAALVFNERALDRHLGNVNVSASEGEHLDRANRLEQFRQRYCDIHDDDDGFAELCSGTGANPATVNKDINYTRIIDHPKTLSTTSSVDITGNPAPACAGPAAAKNPLCQPCAGPSALTNPRCINVCIGPAATSNPFCADALGALTMEDDIYALADNLYGHRVLPRIPESMFLQEINKARILDVRSVAAKRNVAEASFYTIIGMKSQAISPELPETLLYIHKLLEELGVPPSDYQEFLTMPLNPSYYAQMELLTKRIYQNPKFYVNLYENPVNAERKKVALQAIGLMQDFDVLQSYLRTEMMLSLILELEIAKLQEDVQNQIYRLGAEGG